MSTSCDWCGNPFRPTPGGMDNSVQKMMCNVPVNDGVNSVVAEFFHYRNDECFRSNICHDCFVKAIKKTAECLGIQFGDPQQP